MANDATFSKFGKLIKINGSSSDKWAIYDDAKKVAGNIVFADLSYNDNDSSVTEYPKGFYIWANGVEYKVADLVTFNKLRADYDAYVAATDASIARLDSSVNTLETWKANMGWEIDTTNKVVKINGVQGNIKYNDTEYVNIKVDGSTFKVSLDEADIQYGDSSTGAERYLATKGYVDETRNALETRVNTSMGIMNASISDISVKLVDISTRRLTKLVETTSLTASAADNSTRIVLELTTEAGTKTDTSFVITGDEHVKIGGTANDIKVTLNVYNTSIDGLPTSNASVYGAGSIKSYVDRKVANLTGAIRLIGSIDSSDGSTGTSMKSVLTGVDASKGNMWISSASDTFYYTTDNVAMAKKTFRIEPGDQVIITEDRGSLTTDAPFMVVERNLDGAVTAGSNLFKTGHVIVGDTDDSLTVIDSGYTLGGNTSAGITSAATDNVITTEKAVKDFTEARIADISVVADSSSAYLNTTAKRDGDKFTVTTGINVVEFDNANDAKNAVADASTFHQAIKDVKGTLVANNNGTDSSVILSLLMSGGNSSVLINGTNYATVSVTDGSINLGVKTTDLSTASIAADGLAVAANVSAVINDIEKATAAAIAQVKESAGFDDNLKPVWSDGIKANLGISADSSVINTIEVLNTSVTTEVNRLDASIKAMKVTNTEVVDKLLVGVAQENGIISSSSAEIWVNGNKFTRAVDASAFQVTIDGEDILVAGTSRHKDSTIAVAIADLSAAIDGVGADYLKTVTGDAALVVSSSTYAEGSFVSVSASPTANNNTNLDTSVLMAKPIIGDTSLSAVATGLASDAYVKEYVNSILEWEEY